MARVPVITSPCPLRFGAPPTPGRDYCGHCQRTVHNLDLMSDAERASFLESCSGEVCVSYSVKRTRPLPVALGLGLAVMAATPVTGATDYVSADSGGVYTEIENPYGMGGTQAGEKLQWIDDTQAQLPAKADLPDIGEAAWLPSPKT